MVSPWKCISDFSTTKQHGYAKANTLTSTFRACLSNGLFSFASKQLADVADAKKSVGRPLCVAIFEIDNDNWESKAEDRDSWRKTFPDGVASHDNSGPTIYLTSGL